DAEMESYRLSTFVKFPQETPVNPRHLAAAGFHYTGYKDRVKCFCCGLCVESWCQGDDVKSTRWHRNNCEFINGQDSGNQPIGEEPSFLCIIRTITFIYVLRPDTLEMSGFILRFYFYSTFQRIELATIASATDKQLFHGLDLRKESDRMKTFEVWPAQNRTVSSVHLAQSGFFYFGNLDRVQCFSCGGVLRNWNYGDNVNNEHRRHFPHCRYVWCNILNDLESHVCQYPVSPYMRNEESRLETYDHRWPSTNIRATPQQIANAGFFFLGSNRKKWENDCPKITINKMIKKKCEFLLQRKGPDFVHQMVSLYPNLPRPILRGPFDYSSIFSTSPFPQAEVAKQNEKLAKFMKTDLVKVAIEMGFEVDVIKNVVKNKLSSGGSLPTTVAGLVDDITSYEPSDDEDKEEPVATSKSTNVKTPGETDGFVVSPLSFDLALQKLTNVFPFFMTSLSSESVICIKHSTITKSLWKQNQASHQTCDIIICFKQCSKQIITRTLCYDEVFLVFILVIQEHCMFFTPSMEARLRELQEERKCKICLDRVSNIVFVPCGHLCCCSECADGMKKCLICFAKIHKMYKTLMS
uniref:RING-type domain-containing protein n=1 Tax=Ciona savignyi TaxID=51511 RepID=H2Z958_CIOSA